MGKVVVWIVVIIVILGGAWWWWMSQSSAQALAPVDQSAASSATPAQGTQQGSTGTGASVSGSVNVSTGAPVSATVSYDGNSFSPASVTIAKGGTVTFTDAAGKVWIASNQHPSHTGYDGTSRSAHCAAGYVGAKPFDACGGSSSYSFTFDQAGSWGYHNHLNPGAGGVVNVVAQ